MGLVKGKCTECGATLELNNEAKSECICKYCGSKFFVQDAINNYTANIESAQVNIAKANININTINKSKTACPKCDSHNLDLKVREDKHGSRVRDWICKDCGHTWMHEEDANKQAWAWAIAIMIFLVVWLLCSIGVL